MYSTPGGGLAEKTVIILMGDNGYFLGERQLAGKWLMYDNSFRVPLAVFDPREKGGKRVDSFALNIDVPSTILDLAGIAPPQSWQGVSVNSPQLANRKEFLTEHLWQRRSFRPAKPSVPSAGNISGTSTIRHTRNSMT